mgnify:CR=1 FL=1
MASNVILTRLVFSPLPLNVRMAFPFSSCETSFTVSPQISCAYAPLEYITDNRTRSLHPSFSVVSGSGKRISSSVLVKALRGFPFTHRKDFFEILTRLLRNTHPASKLLYCAYSANEDKAPIRCFAWFCCFSGCLQASQQIKIQHDESDMSDIYFGLFIELLKQQPERTFVR